MPSESTCFKLQYHPSLLRSVVRGRVIHFGETFGVQVKGRSPKKLKSLIEVTDVDYVKLHDLRYNMILLSSP